MFFDAKRENNAKKMLSLFCRYLKCINYEGWGRIMKKSWRKSVQIMRKSGVTRTRSRHPRKVGPACWSGASKSLKSHSSSRYRSFFVSLQMMFKWRKMKWWGRVASNKAVAARPDRPAAYWNVLTLNCEETALVDHRSVFRRWRRCDELAAPVTRRSILGQTSPTILAVFFTVLIN